MGFPLFFLLYTSRLDEFDKIYYEDSWHLETRKTYFYLTLFKKVSVFAAIRRVKPRAKASGHKFPSSIRFDKFGTLTKTHPDIVTRELWKTLYLQIYLHGETSPTVISNFPSPTNAVLFQFLFAFQTTFLLNNHIVIKTLSNRGALSCIRCTR